MSVFGESASSLRWSFMIGLVSSLNVCLATKDTRSSSPNAMTLPMANTYRYMYMYMNSYRYTMQVRYYMYVYRRYPPILPVWTSRDHLTSLSFSISGLLF